MKRHLYFLLVSFILIQATSNLNSCTPGAITAGPQVNLPLTSAPSAVAYSPDAKFLAVADQGDNNVSVFSVSTTGILTPVPGSPFATGAEPLALSYSHDGKCLAVANHAANTLTLFSSDSTTGVLTVVDPGFAVGQNPRAVAYDANNHLAVALEGNNEVAVYLSLANCSLSLIGSYPTGASPAALSYSAESDFLAVANKGDNTLSVFNSNSTGQLMLIGTIATGTQPSDVAYASTNFVAVSNQTDNTVSIYHADSATGSLSLIGSYPTEIAPHGVSFSPDGTNLLVTHLSGSISVYTVSSNGILSLLTTDYITFTPLGPARYSPTANFFAVPDIFSGSVYPYTYIQLPDATITSDKLSILPGNKVSVTATITQGQPPFTLEWQFSYINDQGQPIIDSYVQSNVTTLSSTITIDPIRNTTVALKVTDVLGCISANSNSLTITVQPASFLATLIITKYC